jgi:subtilisin-like proprotein convertase family protein
VKDIFKRSCDRIDSSGGKYDANGHSTWYGYGRVNARNAVELARPSVPSHVEIRTVVKNVPIKDLMTSELALSVEDIDALKTIKVGIDIEHTYIGDLIVSLGPPEGTGVAPITLHNREGGGMDNLKKIYDEISAPGLVTLKGKSPKGTWTLVVQDKEKADTGMIRSLTLEMSL